MRKCKFCDAKPPKHPRGACGEFRKNSEAALVESKPNESHWKLS